MNTEKPQTDEDHLEQPEIKPKFNSSFKTWIRVVAFIVVAVFLPEQAAQAMEYDWRVLWQKPAIGSFTPGYLRDLRNIDTALAIKNILKDITNKPITSIKISSNLTVNLDKPLQMSNQKIEEIFDWLKGRPCGSKALYDFLVYQGNKVEEQDIAIMALTVDILSEIVKPEGNPQVIKNSLFALAKASEFFGSKLYPIKADLNNLKEFAPFIAHIKGDHYVLVTRIVNDKVYFSDNHREEFLPFDLFIQRFSGFALINQSTLPKRAVFLTPQESKTILGANVSTQADLNSAMSSADVQKYVSSVRNSLHSEYNKIQTSAMISIGISLGTTVLGGLAAGGAFGGWFGQGDYLGMDMATRFAITGAVLTPVARGVLSGNWNDWYLYAGAGAAVGGLAGWAMQSMSDTQWQQFTWAFNSKSTWSWATWPATGALGGLVIGGLSTGKWFSGDSLTYAMYGAAGGLGLRTLSGLGSVYSSKGDWSNFIGQDSATTSLSGNLSFTNPSPYAPFTSKAYTVYQGMLNAQIVNLVSYGLSATGMNQKDAELLGAGLSGAFLGATGSLGGLTNGLDSAWERAISGSLTTLSSTFIRQEALDLGVKSTALASYIGNVGGLVVNSVVNGTMLYANNLSIAPAPGTSISNNILVGDYDSLKSTVVLGQNQNINDVIASPNNNYFDYIGKDINYTFEANGSALLKGLVSNSVAELVTRYPGMVGLSASDIKSMPYATAIGSAVGGFVPSSTMTIQQSIMNGLLTGGLTIFEAKIESKLTKLDPTAMTSVMAAFVADAGAALVRGFVGSVLMPSPQTVLTIDANGQTQTQTAIPTGGALSMMGYQLGKDSFDVLSFGYAGKGEGAYNDIVYINKLTTAFSPVTPELLKQQMEAYSYKGTLSADGTTATITLSNGTQATLTKVNGCYYDANGEKWDRTSGGKFYLDSSNTATVTSSWLSSLVNGWGELAHDIYQQGAVDSMVATIGSFQGARQLFGLPITFLTNVNYADGVREQMFEFYSKSESNQNGQSMTKDTFSLYDQYSSTPVTTQTFLDEALLNNGNIAHSYLPISGSWTDAKGNEISPWSYRNYTLNENGSISAKNGNQTVTLPNNLGDFYSDADTFNVVQAGSDWAISPFTHTVDPIQFIIMGTQMIDANGAIVSADLVFNGGSNVTIDNGWAYDGTISNGLKPINKSLSQPLVGGRGGENNETGLYRGYTTFTTVGDTTVGNFNFDLTEDGTAAKVNQFGVVVSPGDVIYGQGNDSITGLGKDINPRNLLYTTEDGSYQFRVTSDGTLFGSPSLGDHGVISGFDQTNNSSVKLGVFNYYADSTTTSLIIGAGLGYSVDRGWVEGFTPEAGTLSNNNQSLTLGKDTWIFLTAFGAVGNTGDDSSYKTGTLSSQPLVGIDFSNNYDVNGNEFFNPLLLTAAGAQYTFTSGEVALVNSNIQTQKVDASPSAKGTVAGATAKGDTAATLYGEGAFGEAVAGKNGMDIGQGLYYDVNGPNRQNVFLNGYLTYSGYDTKEYNEGNFTSTYFYAPGAFYGYVSSNPNEIANWHGVTATFQRDNLTAGVDSEGSNYDISVGFYDYMMSQVYNLKGLNATVTFDANGNKKWSNVSISSGTATTSILTDYFDGQTDVANLTGLLTDANGNVLFHTTGGSQYLFRAEEAG
ncbi:MAG: cysteine peptidase family C39 domain-containing protein, partial [Candidatus Omnitrophota bacterium]